MPDILQRCFLPAVAFLLSSVIGIMMVPAVTDAAEDAEVEVICWDDVDDKTQCETVDTLVAECADVDPENTSEQCQDANAAAMGKPTGGGRITMRGGKRTLILGK